MEDIPSLNVISADICLDMRPFQLPEDYSLSTAAGQWQQVLRNLSDFSGASSRLLPLDRRMERVCQRCLSELSYRLERGVLPIDGAYLSWNLGEVIYAISCDPFTILMVSLFRLYYSLITFWTSLPLTAFLD
ncbi:hypothetical protein CROQUDRAFT_418420 [Cronartium quercuum f. sp. fusiforme G11]|uniref:Uncharacterized protein n=1 Tax=Cronartium quercuum f. sp. fusiforme G11 TaxID=708437 RepID=A0A9P6N9A6_9BASI|nr:hypothetical protein CROQUDRAFT_418420 [Cronartium quercuum f. sp. fusiforme G11]